MNKNLKLTTALMSAFLASTSFGLDVGGSIGLESGLRMDTTQTTSDIPLLGRQSVKVKDLNGLTLGANGALTLNKTYIRGFGEYFWVLKTPTYTNFGSNVPLTKEHGFDAGGAVGYTFSFANGEFSLAPEAGFTYSSLLVNKASNRNSFPKTTESAGTGFVGANFNWKLSEVTNFGFLFDFHVAGFRKTDASTLGTIDQGVYFGPEFKLSFDQNLTDDWTLGLGYRFKYLTTSNVKDARFDGVDVQNLTTWWMTNAFMVRTNYTF